MPASEFVPRGGGGGRQSPSRPYYDETRPLAATTTRRSAAGGAGSAGSPELHDLPVRQQLYFWHVGLVFGMGVVFGISRIARSSGNLEGQPLQFSQSYR